MTGGVERMQEICIEELVGAAPVPDVRGAVRERLARKPPRRSRLAFGLVAALAAVILVVVWLGRSQSGDPRLDDLVTALARAGGGTRPAEACAELLDYVEERPELWSQLEPGLGRRLKRGPEPAVRSRLVAALSHAPGPGAEFTLLQQLAHHRSELDSAALVRLAARGIDGAAAALRELAPREDRGPVLHQTWLLANGEPAWTAALEKTIAVPELLERAPHRYFAAVVTLYRAKRYAAWDTCWQMASRFIRDLQRSGDEARAYQLTVTMYWFYGFLNIVEPLPLDDLSRRVARAVRDYRPTRGPGEEIDALLGTMR